MPRPKADSVAIRERLLDAAETILATNGGQRLVLSDVASAVGMTQSNAYRYLRDKDDLVVALARRWFADVERAAKTAIAEAGTAEDRIRAWLLATMRAKIVRYDRDPVLFRAYLELARGYPQVVADHVAHLRGLIEPSVADLVGGDRVGEALRLLEDATILFRNPYLIAQHRADLGEGRALTVLEAVLAGIAKGMAAGGRGR